MANVFSMNQVLCFRFEDLGYNVLASISEHGQWKNSSYVCPLNPECWSRDGKLINQVRTIKSLKHKFFLKF